jgi:hypothetical protein
MAHRAEEISTYDFKSSEALLLDANIWMFVYGPQKSTDTRVAAYSEALAKILAAKSWLFDNIILFSAPFLSQAARILLEASVVFLHTGKTGVVGARWMGLLHHLHMKNIDLKRHCSSLLKRV